VTVPTRTDSTAPPRLGDLNAPAPATTQPTGAAASGRSEAISGRTGSPRTVERSDYSGDRCWLPQGEPVRVAGYDIAGGWLYVGNSMRGPNTSDNDPALIVPALRVDTKRPDYAGDSMGYWPSYSEISPGCRAAYLAWLAGGRSAPQAPLGYVFLYFYGLERRILIDAQHSAAAAAEVPAVLDEIRRLLDIYGHNYSFRNYATGLLGVGVMRAEGKRYDQPPPVNTEKWSAGLPMELLLGLSELVADGKPIPAEWALAWTKWNPESRLRTPAQRCPDEFEALFASVYGIKYGDGMVLKPNRRQLAVTYHPASGGFSHATVQAETNLPDVGALTAPAKALNELAEQACTALDPYSRLLGRKPEAAGTAAALALLPHGLDGGGNEDAEKVWAFAEQRLLAAKIATVRATELIERWPGAHAAKLPKNEAVLLAQLLERRRYGMEPDPRFGGLALAAGTSAVLFRRGQPTVSAPSAAFTGAVSLLQLAAAVATADGKLAEPEEQMLREHVIHGLHLGADEQARLTAHLALVVVHPPTPAALRRRVASLGEADRAAAGQLLIAVAGADGQVTPEEITALVRLFNVLGLNENDVYSQLHSMVAPGSRDALTTARLPGAPVQRYSVPAPSASPSPPTAAPGPVVVLDHALVQAKLEESGRVAALLQKIFEDDDAVPAPAQAVPVVPTQGTNKEVNPLGGLDGAHSTLARDLMTRQEWCRADVEHLAAACSLLPDGALDAINEAALDVSGEPLCEGDDPILINSYAMEEMLR
jgi:tellurite resistance protein